MSTRISRSAEPNRNSARTLGDLGLARAGRPGEQEHALRARRVAETGLHHGDPLHEAFDGLVLARGYVRGRSTHRLQS